MAFRLQCTSCHATKTPLAPIIFSSEDDDKIAPNVTKIYGDLTVQRWNEKCGVCGEFYYLYFQKENKDAIYVCRCSLDLHEEKKTGGKRETAKLSQGDRISNYEAIFSSTTTDAYDFLPILK